MPKEVICQPPSHPGDPGDPYCTHVGWSAEGSYLQVGTVGRDGRSIYWLLFGGGVLLGGEPVGDPELRAMREETSRNSLAQFGALVREVVAEHSSADGETGDNDLAVALLNRFDVTYGSSGLYASHDRVGVNALIKALRRARDAAFGADE